MIKIRLYQYNDEQWSLFNIETLIYNKYVDTILSLDIRASEYIIPKKLSNYNGGYQQNYLQLY